MKKLFLVLAIAGFAVACNNGSETKEEKTDSTTMSTPDSAAKMADTAAAMMDTAAKMMTDTTKH